MSFHGHMPIVFDTMDRARDGSRVPVTMSRPSANTETTIPGSTSVRTSHRIFLYISETA